MAKIASKVILIEAMPSLTATAILRDRLAALPNVDVRTGATVEEIMGEEKVEGIKLAAGVKKESVRVDGVLVHIGTEPNTAYLEGIVPLDEHGQIIVNERMENGVPCVLAAGDIRSGSPRQVVAAVGDGAIAGISAERLLQEER
jgi:thioredoxin reductase (NADPH)